MMHSFFVCILLAFLLLSLFLSSTLWRHGKLPALNIEMMTGNYGHESFWQAFATARHSPAFTIRRRPVCAVETSTAIIKWIVLKKCTFCALLSPAVHPTICVKQIHNFGWYGWQYNSYANTQLTCIGTKKKKKKEWHLLHRLHKIEIYFWLFFADRNFRAPYNIWII